MKSSKHSTAVGNIKFMAIARPLLNKQTGKEEYSIKLEFDGSTPEGLALRQAIQAVQPKKIVTNNVSKQGNFILSFSTTYAPTVLDSEDNPLTGDTVPFFDSRTDTGQASVVYNVIDYGNTQIIRLAGVKLMQLDLAEREDSGGASADEILKLLKASQ